MSASWVGFCLAVVTLFVGVPLGWALIWGFCRWVEKATR